MLKRIAIVAVAGLGLVGCSQTSEKDYTNAQVVLAGSPQVKAKVLRDCTGKLAARPRSERDTLAALANTSLESAPAVVCRRIVNAWATGRLTYADIQATERGTATPNSIKIIQGR